MGRLRKDSGDGTRPGYVRGTTCSGFVDIFDRASDNHPDSSSDAHCQEAYAPLRPA
jgi:hypothetical protein